MVSFKSVHDFSKYSKTVQSVLGLLKPMKLVGLRSGLGNKKHSHLRVPLPRPKGASPTQINWANAIRFCPGNPTKSWVLLQIRLTPSNAAVLSITPSRSNVSSLLRFSFSISISFQSICNCYAMRACGFLLFSSNCAFRMDDWNHILIMNMEITDRPQPRRGG